MPTLSLVSTFDLPATDARGRELSGIAWDESSHMLFAVSDSFPRIVPLIPSAAFDGWTFGTALTLTLADHWDGEGIALAPSGFFLANERGPHIYEVDRTGVLRRELPLSSGFGDCIPNKCIESLALSPDGRFLFYANESALSVDGAQPTAVEGTTVRLVRRDVAGGNEIVWAYHTEPIFSAAGGGDMGVSEIAALSATSLLVLERSYVPGRGASARIFHVKLKDGDAQGARPFASCTAVKKTLLVDIGMLLRTAPQGDAVPLPNYEGMAMGPSVGPGGRLLFLISDDNANPNLPARVLTLRLSGGGALE